MTWIAIVSAAVLVASLFAGWIADCADRWDAKRARAAKRRQSKSEAA